MKAIKLLGLLLAFGVMLANANAQTSKYAALAIDRSNGFYYGWSYDYASLAEAEGKALAECVKRGGSCAVVLSWSGTGCGVYRTINGEVGTAYGWGVAPTKAEADTIAAREGLKRSSGKPLVNNVWACNSANSGDFKTLKDEDQRTTQDTAAKNEAPPAEEENTVEGESLDGNLIVIGTPAGKIRIQNAANKNVVREFAGHSSAITVVSFSGDGTMIASGDSSGVVKLWSTGSGSLLRTIKSHNSPITMAMIGADNVSLMTATGEELTDVKGWDLKTGDQVIGNQ